MLIRYPISGGNQEIPMLILVDKTLNRNKAPFKTKKKNLPLKHFLTGLKKNRTQLTYMLCYKYLMREQSIRSSRSQSKELLFSRSETSWWIYYVHHFVLFFIIWEVHFVKNWNCLKVYLVEIPTKLPNSTFIIVWSYSELHWQILRSSIGLCRIITGFEG